MFEPCFSVPAPGFNELSCTGHHRSFLRRTTLWLVLMGNQKDTSHCWGSAKKAEPPKRKREAKGGFGFPLAPSPWTSCRRNLGTGSRTGEAVGPALFVWCARMKNDCSHFCIACLHHTLIIYCCWMELEGGSFNNVRSIVWNMLFFSFPLSCYFSFSFCFCLCLLLFLFVSYFTFLPSFLSFFLSLSLSLSLSLFLSFSLSLNRQIAKLIELFEVEPAQVRGRLPEQTENHSNMRLGLSLFGAEEWEAKGTPAGFRGSLSWLRVKTVLGSHFGGLVNSPPVLGPIEAVGLGCSLGANRFGF